MSRKQVLCVMMVLGCALMAGCQSKAARAFDDQVLAIGEVTEDDRDAIAAAESMYAALSEKEQGQVKNLETLRQARDAYSKLVAEDVSALIRKIENAKDPDKQLKKAEDAYAALSEYEKTFVKESDTLLDYIEEKTDPVDQMIEDIGEVTLGNEMIILKAERAYAALSAVEQEYVAGKETLENARKTFTALRIARVEELIDAIGEVTLDSEKKILSAKTAFAELSEADQKTVKNAKQLTDAQALFEQMKEEESQRKIAEAETAIEAIGTVSEESGDLLKAAEKAYGALSAEEKEQVKNQDVLETAQAEYEDLTKIKPVEKLIKAALKDTSKLDEANTALYKLTQSQREKVSNKFQLEEKRAEVVTGQIDAIGTVTLGKEQQITDAEDAYNKLGPQEKSLVKNYNVLTKAKKSLAELKKENLIGKMKKERDDVEDVTFYMTKAQPYYINDRCYVLPYLSVSDGYPKSPHLRMQYVYAGRDWVFFEKVIIVTDNNKYTKTFSYFDTNHETSWGGNLYEYVDISSGSSDINMLKDMAKSKNVTVRFQGDSNRYDMTMSQADKNGIQDVVDLYEAMKQ